MNRKRRSRRKRGGGEGEEEGEKKDDEKNNNSTRSSKKVRHHRYAVIDPMAIFTNASIYVNWIQQESLVVEKRVFKVSKN